MVYGYIRISTNRQSLERQRVNILKKYPNAIIVEEIFTGTKLEERVRFMKLLSKIKEGDTIVFDSVSRMSRDSDAGVKLYFELLNKGVNLEFLKEPHINTDVYKDRLKSSNNIVVEDAQLNTTVMKGIREYLDKIAGDYIKIAFDQSEKETNDLRKRTSEGIAIAKLKGKQIGGVPGKKRKSAKREHAREVIKEYHLAFNGKFNDVKTMAMIRGLNPTLGISRKTYYKYKNELILEMISSELEERKIKDDEYIKSVINKVEDDNKGEELGDTSK